MNWLCCNQVIPLNRPVVMGIINITPDSFSDGGAFADPARAISRGEAMVAAGAALLDIGGESTRPGAQPVSTAEELRRILPVLKGLKERVSVPLSIDTRNPAVAAAALAEGAHIINDVAAHRSDPMLWQHVARHRAGYVAMHMQGQPDTMQLAPIYGDVVREVQEFFADRLSQLAAHGVAPAQVVLDPGIGFGKNLEHNLALLRSPCLVGQAGRPVLLGVSRKSFIGKLLGAGVDQRQAAGLACTLWAAQRGVRIFRTHEVFDTIQALNMWEALETQPGNREAVGPAEISVR